MQHPVLQSIFAVFLIGGAGVLLSGCDTTQAQGQPAPAPIPEVGVVEIQPQTVTLSTELAGRTTPYLIAEVRPQVSGIIQQRLFSEGSEIEAGQVLYQIDPATYQAAYDNAKATLARDEAALTSAQLKVKRYKNLVKIKAVSQEAYDDAVAALKQAQATVAMSDAAVQSARINLDYTQVTSPIAGRIGRSTVTPGALVTANQSEALATVRQLDPIYVDVTQSSAQLLQLKRALASGQLQRAEDLNANVELILEDGSRYSESGRLQFSEVNVDESTGTLTLRAVFPNPEQVLLPGMYVRAVIHEGVKPEAILAPQRSITRDTQGNATALVLNEQGVVEQRLLAVDRSIGHQWLVTAGLEAGDQLIVDGLQKVRPGAPARAVSVTLDTDSATLARN